MEGHEPGASQFWNVLDRTGDLDHSLVYFPTMHAVAGSLIPTSLEHVVRVGLALGELGGREVRDFSKHPIRYGPRSVHNSGPNSRRLQGDDDSLIAHSTIGPTTSFAVR